MVVSLDNFDASQIRFGEVKEVVAPHGKFNIVPIFYGSEKLVIHTSECKSWRLQKEKKGDNFKFPILVKDKNMVTGELEPTARQDEFVELFSKILKM